MAHPLTRSLFDPEPFEAQIEIVHGKYRVGGGDITLKQQGVELASIALESRSFARALVKDVKSGAYALQPARLLEIEVGEKMRIIYQFRISDLLVHGVVSNLIHEICIPKFSPNLHSYMKGRNWWEAIHQFAAYARGYHDSVTDKFSRGLYVLRRDIKSYTDSIPVGVGSPLWPLLKKELEFPENPKGDDLRAWKIIEAVIRTEAITLDGLGHFTTIVGVPTGSPISTTLFNVYLMNLDRAIDAARPAYWARYGDDLILADPDPEKIKRIDSLIVEILKHHQLASNQKKSLNLHFNAAARPSTVWPETRGADKVIFLGCDIGATGLITLSLKNKRALLDELKARLKNLDTHIGDALPMERMRMAASIVNSAIDPNHRLAHKTASLLRHVVTDRPSLKDLDRTLALMVLSFATGSSSVKAFRDISFRSIRSEGQLISLYHRRNLVGKRR